MLVFRQALQCVLLAAGMLAVAGAAAPGPAWAQGKLEAHYAMTLAGIPIGKGSWVIDITDTSYTAAANGTTTGLMRAFTGGQGTTAARGAVQAGRLVPTEYAATISTRKKTGNVRLTLDNGNVKDFKLNPPQNKAPGRVPVTEAHRHGILDPMTASLVRMPGAGNLLARDVCQRKLAIFDGRLRYDLKLDFKRFDNVKAEKGYGGPVVVCAVYFSPVAGFEPSRSAIKYISKLRDMEVWLAPIAGTRVLVPFRAQGPTPIGEAVLEATHFVSIASPTRASVKRINVQ